MPTKFIQIEPYIILGSSTTTVPNGSFPTTKYDGIQTCMTCFGSDVKLEDPIGHGFRKRSSLQNKLSWSIDLVQDVGEAQNYRLGDYLIIMSQMHHLTEARTLLLHLNMCLTSTNISSKITKMSMCKAQWLLLDLGPICFVKSLRYV